MKSGQKFDRVNWDLAHKRASQNAPGLDQQSSRVIGSASKNWELNQ